jgi:hypothetical protein
MEEKMEKVTIIRGVKMIVEQKAVESTDEIDWLTNWEKACEKKSSNNFYLDTLVSKYDFDFKFSRRV